MKNGIIFAGLAIAIGAGGYYAYQQNVSAGAGSVAYVPSDTLFFMGDLEPASWNESITPLQSRFTHLFTNSDLSSLQEIENLQKEIEQNPNDWSDGLRFILGVYAEYVTSFTKGNLTPDTLGVADKLDAAIYTVGALPVLRIKIGNEMNFDKFISAAELRTNVKAENGTFNNVTYKKYIFSKDEKHPAALVLAKKDGFAIFTLDLGSQIPANDFSVALGITKPAQTLLQANTLQDLVKEYGFNKNSLGFINNELLVKALTRPENPLAQLLNQLTDGESATGLQDFRTAECQKDIESIAALWPREVFGYTNLELNSSPIRFDSQFRIESKDAATLESLQKLRGFSPKFDQPSLMNMSIGFNVNEVGPVVNGLWQRATAATYSCPALKDIQTSLKMTNPAMLGMATAMVQGLQGISFNLHELKLNPNAQDIPDAIEKLSFLTTISAQSPQQIWAMASMAMQETGLNVQLPADGQITDFPIPPVLSLPEKVKLGLFGNHIAIFTGETSENAAKSLAKQPLTANGFYNFGFDYGLLADLASFGQKQMEAASADMQISTQEESASTSGAENTVKPEETAEQKEMKQVVQMLENMRGMKLQSSLDFDAKGIVLKGNMELPAQANK